MDSENISERLGSGLSFSDKPVNRTVVVQQGGPSGLRFGDIAIGDAFVLEGDCGMFWLKVGESSFHQIGGPDMAMNDPKAPFRPVRRVKRVTFEVE